MNNTITDQEWNSFGYESKEPCVVCGKAEDTKSEPRFGYTVCRDHAHIPPTEIAKHRKNS